jgi:hypothetical protein
VVLWSEDQLEDNAFDDEVSMKRLKRERKALSSKHHLRVGHIMATLKRQPSAISHAIPLVQYRIRIRSTEFTSLALLLADMQPRNNQYD